MSVPSLAPAVTPFAGPVAVPVARRSADARPANDDADNGPDFASVLKDADTDTDAPIKAATSSGASAPTAASKDAAPSDKDERNATDASAVVTPLPPPAPAPLVAVGFTAPPTTTGQTPAAHAAPDASPSIPTAASTPVAAPTASPSTIPTPPVAAADTTGKSAETPPSGAAPSAPTPSSEIEVAFAASGTPPVAAPSPTATAGQAASAATTAAATLVAVPRLLRPTSAEPLALTDEPTAAPTAGGTGETVESSDAGLQALAQLAPRARDIVERDSGGRSEAKPQAKTSSGTDTAVPTAGDANATPSAPTSAKPPIAPPAPETTPALLADDAVTATTQTASSSAPETRAADVARALTQSLNLSTTSRASVEATTQIAAQIIKKLDAKATRFEIALTPDDLGRVDVSLGIDADGQLAARLSFDNPLAAADLRARADELRRQLEDAGFKLAEDALSFAERDSSAGQGSASDRHQTPSNARAFGAASRLGIDADLAATPRWIQLSLTPDRVDLKV